MKKFSHFFQTLKEIILVKKKYLIGICSKKKKTDVKNVWSVCSDLLSHFLHFDSSKILLFRTDAEHHQRAQRWRQRWGRF